MVISAGGAGSTAPVAAGAPAAGTAAGKTSVTGPRPENQYQPAPATMAANSTITPIPAPLEDFGSGKVSGASG
ncbi:hypothetical protein [Variovorax sp. LG9.2]|uniref:hypothetical protein n=1 Tax=Variovorax sp. LG9.2 TaxID=3048626 RepID=UPI002B2373F6|nr:hypothetical protein [Variovorax sp. LG9.2]MEB0057448.1 hypothetical protein [Variovorax sp. LG9.2]